MAGMRFIDIVTDAEEITQVRSIREVVKRLCNNVVAEICGMSEWPFLWTDTFFQTIAAYSDGTVSVTNGSPTITGSSTTFTSAMVGRKIRISGQMGYYTIKSFGSITSLTLDEQYTGSADSGLSYSIYKDEYLLRADLDQQKKIRQSENGVALFSMSASGFDEMYPIPFAGGVSGMDVYLGRAVRTYSTGTVSMASSTRTLTGSGTAWTTAEGIGRGTKLKIGTLLFTVNTVDSDTQITTYEAATSTISAGTAYTAILDNPVVELHAIPQTQLTFYYRFQRIPAVLDADNDMPDMPHAMHPLIGLGMLPTLWRQRGNIDRAVEAQNAFATSFQKWLDHFQIPVLDRRNLLQPFLIRRKIAEARWPIGTGLPLYR